MKQLKHWSHALVFLLLLTPASAQQPDTFKSQSNLVIVPVEVRKKGQHVSGLDKSKFTVLQDGSPQPVTVFEEVRTNTERLKKVQVGPRGFSNQYEGSPASARYTIIAIDRINTTTMDMQRLRLGLEKFLQQVADSGEPIRLVAINSSNIEVLQDFTTNPKVLAAALQRNRTPAGRTADSSVVLNETQALVEQGLQQQFDQGWITNEELATRLAQLDSQKDNEQTMIAFQQRSRRINSLEALQMLAQSLAGLPGRKSLVWASSGYPFMSMVREGRGGVTMDFSQVAEAGNLDEYTLRLINAANIAIYPVDARGTINTAWDVMDPSHKYSPSYAEKDAARMKNQETITTFEHLAASTGGKPCYERAELSGCFSDALDDARDYYILGYYADTKMKPGWHKLQVKVDADANVRSRTGFIYSKLDENQVRTNDMHLQLSSRLIDPGIPFRGQWSIKEPKGDKKGVSFEMSILPDAKVVSAQEPHLNVEIAALARAKDGSVAGQFGQKIDRQLPPEAISTIEKTGIQYHNVMALAPGDYMVRIVVRDANTGRMGSATTLVTVD